jgi:23S rRNA G2069 N7-methylase RlmK/C1962 C5-methylase RlmI
MHDKTASQAQMFSNRLQKRFRHLKKWAQRTGVGAFRLYDRDIPEIPLVLDFYGDCNKTGDAALCGALYKRPYEKDENEEGKWLSVMTETAGAALGINPEHAFFKQQKKKKGLSQYEKISGERFEKIVGEGGLSFKVNLSDYLDTGFFIDRRLLRGAVRAQSNNKKVLNLFSYTGSFSVYAASGGALSTDSVDLSNTYLNWARENFSLNSFSADVFQLWDFFKDGNSASDEDLHCTNKLIRADVFEFLEKASTAEKQWDIIVLDPPGFSNSKKMAGNFDLQRDLTELLGKCLKLLSPTGKLFLSVNIKRSAPTAFELEAALRPYTVDLRVTDLGEKIIDEDFKGKKAPKAFLFTVLHE